MSRVQQSFEQSLRELDLGYIDLVRQPIPSLLQPPVSNT